jgi:chromosome segregation ATPase
MGDLNNINAQLQSAREAVDKMKSARARAEADYDNYMKRQQELEEEIRALGVEPEQLEEKIQGLEASITENMAKIWGMIPEQFRG